MQQLDPELEALCDFTLILVPTNALPQEQQPAHEGVGAPAAGNSREQQPREPSSAVTEQAPQPCGERQAAGTSGGFRASRNKLEGETSQAAGVHSKGSQQRARRLPQDENVRRLDEFLKEVRTIINRKLWGKKEMSAFKEPVDPVKLNIPDYHTIIKHPMDVGTVRKKLDIRQYSSPLEVRDDLRLVLRNSATYNPPGHAVRIAGDVLANVFEAAWAESKIEERWNEYLVQHDPKAPQPCGGGASSWHEQGECRDAAATA